MKRIDIHKFLVDKVSYKTNCQHMNESENLLNNFITKRKGL